MLSRSGIAVASAVVAVVAGGCATRTAPAAAEMDHAHMHGDPGPITIPPGAIFTPADVHFMQGMIAHHAQAIHMSRLAAKRGASPRLLRFAESIDHAQRSEIVVMQEWLVANGQTAPDTTSHLTMSMPGMLTAAQLDQLEKSRGKEFDRQFLLLMIQHHEGALKMVADLYAARGAAQDPDVSGLASDIDVVQTAEIDLMRRMLADL